VEIHLFQQRFFSAGPTVFELSATRAWLALPASKGERKNLELEQDRGGSTREKSGLLQCTAIFILRYHSMMHNP
jgi:hypothetical protein